MKTTFWLGLTLCVVTSVILVSAIARSCELPPPIWLRSIAGADKDTGAVAGSVTLEAVVSDEVKVTGVEFLVDGKVLATDTEAPYSVVWDTTKVANGEHSVQARGNVAEGAAVVSKPLKVVVANQASTDTSPSQ